MRFRRVKVSAPGSVANFGAGFDSFACAIDGVEDIVTLEVDAQDGDFTVIRGVQGLACLGARSESEAPKTDIAEHAVRTVLMGRCSGVITIEKGIPIARGLGSSSASAVAAAVAATYAAVGEVDLMRELTVHNLIESAARAEYLNGNGVIADNVAASLVGGFVSVSAKGDGPYRCLRISTPAAWRLAIAVPEFALRTADARAVTQEPAGHNWNALTQTANQTARMAIGFIRADIRMVGEAMMNGIADRLRLAAGLIPYGLEVLAEARRAGASGTCIAGAGPSLAALCSSERLAEDVGDAMVAMWRERGIGATCLVTRIGAPGARILEAE